MPTRTCSGALKTAPGENIPSLNLMQSRQTQVNPAISVLLAVHNGERYVQHAVQSVLSQTFGNYELLIIDDASTDGTASILDRFSDERIVRITNDENLGLTRSLIQALPRCRAPLIARMDGDDISEPTRFDRQFARLDAHPDVALVACLTRHIDEQGRELATQRYAGDLGFLKWDLCRWNPLFHPTVMFRKAAVEEVGGYDPRFRYAQDYDLFTRLVMAGHRVENITEPLLRFREWGGSVTKQKRQAQAELELDVRRRYVAWMLGREVSDEALIASRRLLSWTPLESFEHIRAGLRLIVATRAMAARGAPKPARREINRVVRQFLGPQARFALGRSPADAVAIGATLLRIRGARRAGVAIVARGTRGRLSLRRRLTATEAQQ